MFGCRSNPAASISRLCAHRTALLVCLLLFGLLQAAEAQPARAALPTVLRVHARSVETTVSALRNYLPVPLKPEAALDSLLGPAGVLVQLTAPVDLVVALDTQSLDSPAPPLWVVVMSVRSLDEARKQAGRNGLVLDTQGAWSRFQSKSRSDTWHCLLGPGPSGSARLACSLAERSRDELAESSIAKPALTTTSDLRAELYVDTLVQTYDGLWQRALQLAGMLVPQKLQLGQPVFDRALTDATQTLVGQLAMMSRELRRVSLDVRLDNSGAQLQLGYELTGQTSWWGQSDAQAADGLPPTPPALFWSLSKDSGSASFAVGDPRPARQILSLLTPLLDGFLTHDGLPAADRQAILGLLTGLSLPDGWLTSVFAEVSASPSAAVRGDRPGQERPLGGATYLLASEGQKGLTLDWLKSIVGVYKRPGVQSYLRTKWKTVAKSEPLPALRMQPAAKSLGAGAMQFTLSLTLPAALEKAAAGRVGAAAPAGRAAATPWVLHLIGVPQGERTWMAVGSDPSALTTALTTQLSIAADATLAKRPGLTELQAPGLRSGGYTSLQSIARYLESGLAMSRMRLPAGQGDKSGLADFRQIFNMIPHHGETSLVYTSRVRRVGEAGKGGPLLGEIALQAPRTVIEDLVALVMHLAL
ncbi:MAG TPA: hypothetical protein PKI03_17580 [Pseudomonadota bacterium]|nr:hypothetical protein [Pseudomonadota bacterium]